MIFLAQATDLPAIPSETFKWVIATLVFLLLVAIAIIGLIKSYAKPAPTRLDDDPAIQVRKAAKRYNHDAIETRFFSVERQVAENTSEIDTLWTTMRAEDKATRDENQRQFNEIARALGRIEGTLGTKP